MRRDEGAQMMLLAAVLLVIGFIALAGLVSTAQRLGDETLQEQSPAVLLENGPVSDILANITEQIQIRLGADPGATAFEQELRGAMRHMENLTASHGFLFKWGTCPPPSSPGLPWRMWFTLSDSRLQLNTTVVPDLASPINCP